MSIEAERRAIEATYLETCTVYRFKKVTENGITMLEKAELYAGARCALSQKANRPAGQTDAASMTVYDAMLFTAPELIIPAGSHVSVARFGRMLEFVASGEGFVYDTHQEIALLRSDKA